MNTLICCIAKNENKYIREWVEWYKKIGVTLQMKNPYIIPLRHYITLIIMIQMVNLLAMSLVIILEVGL